jgi:hypothetical protein
MKIARQVFIVMYMDGCPPDIRRDTGHDTSLVIPSTFRPDMDGSPGLSRRMTIERCPSDTRSELKVYTDMTDLLSLGMTHELAFCQVNRSFQQEELFNLRKQTAL